VAVVGHIVETAVHSVGTLWMAEHVVGTEGIAEHVVGGCRRCGA